MIPKKICVISKTTLFTFLNLLQEEFEMNLYTDYLFNSTTKSGCSECGKSSGHHSYCSESISSFIKPIEPLPMPLIKLGCSECGKLTGHYSSCSQSPSKSLSYYTPSDAFKLSKVKTWAYVDNPVSAECRCCGHTGLVNNPCIGLY